MIILDYSAQINFESWRRVHNTWGVTHWLIPALLCQYPWQTSLPFELYHLLWPLPPKWSPKSFDVACLLRIPKTKRKDLPFMWGYCFGQTDIGHCWTDYTRRWWRRLTHPYEWIDKMEEKGGKKVWRRGFHHLKCLRIQTMKYFMQRLKQRKDEVQRSCLAFNVVV